MEQHPIKKRRLESGMTQVELANAIKVKQGSIAKFENGLLVPSLRSIKKIARVFDIDVSLMKKECSDWEHEYIQHAWRVKL